MDGEREESTVVDRWWYDGQNGNKESIKDRMMEGAEEEE